ncbi:MAG: septal ring lytic transglycosylase RlpA family protein [Cyanobacteria bacterium J06642_11]
MPSAILFMSQRLISGIVATALISAFVSTSERVNAQTLDTAYENSLQISATQNSLAPASTNALQSTLRSDTTVRVNAHPFDNRQAATVYIKNIPVLTYVDQAETSQVVSGWLSMPAEPMDGAVGDAAEIATRLEQLTDSSIEFTARWNDGDYVVMAGDAPLVTLSDAVQSPDATDNKAEDVLQVTNRMRRLLGNDATEPVTQVMGKPAQRVAAVRSSNSGMASWYGPGFHGRTSASGEAFNQYAMTAAHRTLPFGTQVRVTNLNNGRQVVVRINDRGPYSHGRIIDLSAGAASAIGLQSAGVGPVQIEVLR